MDKHQFSAWLRASSDHPPRKTVVLVPGNQLKGCDKVPRIEPHHHPTTDTSKMHTSSPSTNGIPDSTPINLESDMEVEPNPGVTDPFYFQKSNIAAFNA